MRRFLVLGPIALLLLSGCSTRWLTAWIHDTPPPPPPPPGGQELTDMLVWAMGVSFIGVAASVAALVWMPMKKLAIAALAGFLAMFALAVGTKVVQPYLGYVVLGAMLLLAAGAAIMLRKLYLANLHSVAFGTAALAATDPASIQRLKDTHAAAQKAAGVHGIIERALETVSPKA